MREVIIFLTFVNFVGLMTWLCVHIGLHIWKLKNAIKEFKKLGKRLAELEKKLDSVQH